MHEKSLILKQDMLGRVHTSAERRAGVVAEFRRSGLSGCRFARMAGIKYPTLMAWVKRETPPVGSAPAASGRSFRRLPALMEAVVAGSPDPSAPLLLHLGGGAHLELREPVHAVLAAQLIQTLRKSC